MGFSGVASRQNRQALAAFLRDRVLTRALVAVSLDKTLVGHPLQQLRGRGDGRVQVNRNDLRRDTLSLTEDVFQGRLLIHAMTFFSRSENGLDSSPKTKRPSSFHGQAETAHDGACLATNP
jgi:hypothetical protein